LSPAPDASLSNPAIREIDDPVINVDDLDFYDSGGYWAKGFDPTDPMVSPLFIEPAVLAALPPTTIYIGTLEIGLPDTLLFWQKWNTAGGMVSLVIGQGQIHDWALGGSINSQASKVRPDIYRQLGLTDSAAGPITITV
ncbi:MAG TPA: alpha/beta hydrolase fold domain-containing protein, partial [Mycobacterium sp.]|nr:alpha/beta hydrolase fold domain-containing protein [Mycobacterium sp.]